MREDYIFTVEFTRIRDIMSNIFDVEKEFAEGSPERQKLFEARCKLGEFENIRRANADDLTENLPLDIRYVRKETLIIRIKNIFEDEDLTWEQKYNYIFKIYGCDWAPKYGTITWCDPDMGYDDDTRAFYSAFMEAQNKKED